MTYSSVHHISHVVHYIHGFPWWLSGKNTPAIQEPQEMWIQSLAQEDPLE